MQGIPKLRENSNAKIFLWNFPKGKISLILSAVFLSVCIRCYYFLTKFNLQITLQVCPTFIFQAELVVQSRFTTQYGSESRKLSVEARRGCAWVAGRENKRLIRTVLLHHQEKYLFFFSFSFSLLPFSFRLKTMEHTACRRQCREFLLLVGCRQSQIIQVQRVVS